MKKTSLITLIIGVLLVFIGMLWSGFSLRRVRDDIDMVGHKHYTPLSSTFDAGSVRTIKTDLGDVQIAVATDPGSTHVTVDYFKTPTDSFRVSAADGTLAVTRAQAPPSTIMCLLRCLGKPNNITIHIPADSAFAYDLTVNNAPVHFTNTTTLQTGTIRVRSSNSTVRLQNIAAHGTVDLGSDNGNIRLHDLTADGTVTLGSSNGTNELVHVIAPALHARSDNGGATLDTVIVKDLTVHASNATITLRHLQASRSTLVSNNGGVVGSLVGPKSDYALQIASSNGTIRLDGTPYEGMYHSDNASAPKSLTVTTSNATADLTFDR